MERRGYLGLDLGTQGVSVIFADESLEILATGEGSYEMVPGLAAECYEQRPADWERAVADAAGQMHRLLSEAGIEPQVLAIGISGQMHGEVLCDAAGEPLAAVRLWCDARNEAEGHELTERLGVKCPKRMTVARWLWTIRTRPDLAARTVHLTTPGGWLAHRLTGEWNLGIGDASGMFPIDQATLDYDRGRLEIFDTLAAEAAPHAGLPPLAGLLPQVRRCGEDAGRLDARGAALLGLAEGIPLAAAEGDQPAALAGSLIAEPGMVAMSFGTSVVANAVGDRPFRGVSRAIDHFCAADGRPINMVWLRNGTTAMNAVVRLVGGEGDAFAAVMPQLLAAPDDCGGLLALPFMDDEPGLGVSRGGTALLVGLNPDNATPGNAARAMLLATAFNLRLGCEELDRQGFPRSEIVLSGGLVKTPELGGVIADAFATPVTIPDAAAEGSAFGAVLLANYLGERLSGGDEPWSAFLARHAGGTARRFDPRPQSASTLAGLFDRYRKLLAARPALEAAG